MVPHTPDGRVMFAIPWNGHTVVGTTDTPITQVSLEPRPLPEEVDFILETAGVTFTNIRLAATCSASSLAFVRSLAER